MFGTILHSSLPDEAIEYAGFVLTHCAAIADANREGELICPFAVLTSGDGRQIVNFESTTQEEAVARGWASLDDAKSNETWWAFGREGIYRESDGKGTDVLTVTVWIPGMKNHHSILQRFGRDDNQIIYLIGKPELLRHEDDTAEPIVRWNEAALIRGITSHPKGSRWSQWRMQ